MLSGSTVKAIIFHAFHLIALHNSAMRTEHRRDRGRIWHKCTSSSTSRPTPLAPAFITEMEHDACLEA